MTLDSFFKKYVFRHTDGNVPMRSFELQQLYYLATQKDLTTYHRDRWVVEDLLEKSNLPRLKNGKITQYLIHDDALSEMLSLIMKRVF